LQSKSQKNQKIISFSLAPSCQENAATEGGQLSPEFEEFAADLEGQLESDGDDDKTSNRGSHIKHEDWVEEKVANACDKLRKVIEIRLVFPFQPTRPVPSISSSG
jgi:hypothetical protein